MNPEMRHFLLRDGESVEVTKDLSNRRVTFVFRGLVTFEMHIRQAYHLAKFLAGIGSAMDEELSIPTEDDDTKPTRPSVLDLDLSDANDPD